eukprot:15331556-Alexandrium_andersonii.AAC.1
MLSSALANTCSALANAAAALANALSASAEALSALAGSFGRANVYVGRGQFLCALSDVFGPGARFRRWRAMFGSAGFFCLDTDPGCAEQAH